MRQPIPEAALKKHIAILGMNGSGKTSVAKAVIIEPALFLGERVCNIDPTGVGWGLRLMADGHKKGYSIYIVGGDHADFPLHMRDGGAWAEIVGTTSDSFVFDTSQMTVADRSKWFTAFAETLLRKNKGPLKLVIDEAHLFAPQGGAKSGGLAPDMLHATNNLLALGRSRGLRITMISQRPAKLHKDSLTQAHTLIAMALMAPQDRNAVNEWIVDQADAGRGREIIASLPTLEPGEGWVWAPREKVLERVHFPRPKTFDSSSAPDDDAGTGPTLSPINPDVVKAKLETLAKETTANDPAKLRAENARLKTELFKAASRELPVVRDDEALAAEYQRGFGDGELSGLHDGFVSGYNAAQNDASKAIMELDITPRLGEKKVQRPAPRPLALRPAAPISRATAAPRMNGALHDGINGPEQRILDALAWWRAVGIEQPSKVQVAVVARYSPNGGAFNNPLGTLRTKGMIDYPQSGVVVLTAEGAAIANHPNDTPTNSELHQRVFGILDGPQKRILEPLIQVYPDRMDKADLAAAAGYSPDGGAFNNPLGALRSLGFIDRQPGSVRAQPILFVE